MELLFPRSVVYKIEGPVTVEEVIATLKANQLVTAHLDTILEELVPGLHIETIDLRVEEVALSSLKEIFTIAVVALYQETLEENIPPFLSHVTGVAIDPELNRVVTCAFLLVLYFGVDFLQKVALEKLDATVLRQRIDALVSELSKLSGRTEPQIRRALEKAFTRKSAVREIGRAAKQFFSPSRDRNDEPIFVDELQIEPEIIKAVPRYINEDALDDDIPPKHLPGVSVEVRATDSDKDSQGWAGIVRAVSERRMIMRLFPGVDKERLRKDGTVWADVMVHYKEKNGELKPTSFDLIQIVDGPPSEAAVR